jgi:hypothetical protein
VCVLDAMSKFDLENPMHDQPWTIPEDRILFQELMTALREGERVMGYHSPTAKRVAKQLGRTLCATQTRFNALRAASRFMLSGAR